MELGRTKNSQHIRARLLRLVAAGRTGFVLAVAKEFGVSRQSVHRHLSWLVKRDMLIAEGATRARTYRLGPVRTNFGIYDLTVIDEHGVHAQDFAFVFEGLPDNVHEICGYGFTEMVNNAVDHAEGSTVEISADRDHSKVTISISDDGEGIFLRIARLLGLSDPRESLLELSKGKLTTDPQNHTGEGIFFTSRAFDQFYIVSGELAFSHEHRSEDDYLSHQAENKQGTTVLMQIALENSRDLGEIFDEFSSGPDEYRFERTVVPVRLAVYEGERLLSRSQAKRLLNRVERFRRVVFDFDEVETIGQAFADEVFRVFKNSHPEIELISVNTSPNVNKMINRALSRLNEGKT